MHHSRMEGFAIGPNWSEHWRKVKFTVSDEDDDDFDYKNQEKLHERTVIRNDGIHCKYDDDGGGSGGDNDNCHQGGGARAVSSRRMSSCEICVVGTRRRNRTSLKIRETETQKRISNHNRFTEDNEMINARGFIHRSDDQIQNIKRNRSWPDHQSPHRQRSVSFQTHRQQQAVDNNLRTVSQICEICFCDGVPLLSRSCCSFPVCLWCFRKYLTTRIDEGDHSLHCINYQCRKEILEAEIFKTVSIETADKFKRILADKKRSVQTCPNCNTITVVSDKILNRLDSKTPDLFVICPVCDKVWTYNRSVPGHLEEKARRKDEADFERWTRRTTTDSRRNARRCPVCKVKRRQGRVWSRLKRRFQTVYINILYSRSHEK